MEENKFLKCLRVLTVDFVIGSATQSFFGATYILFRVRQVKIMEFTEQVMGFH